VRVGLMAGAGGSQRVARLAGPEDALQMLLKGDQLSPARAKAIGLVTEVVPRNELIAAAKAWIKATPRSVQPWDEDGFRPPGGKVYSPAGFNVFPAAVALYRRETNDNFPGIRNTLKAFVEGLQVPFDVGLRIGNLPDSSLVARRLAVFRTQVYASPSYLARHGEPLHPDDLQHHRTLGFPKFRRNGEYVWPLSDGERSGEFRIDPILVANDPAALKGALLSGEGLMLASDVTIKAYAEQGCVQRVLAGWTGPEMDFNAVFPRGRVQSPKVRAFVDFLVERLNFDADYMHVLCPDMKRRNDESRLAAQAIGRDTDRAVAELEAQSVTSQSLVREPA